jgi:hypothetical protein
MHYMYNVSGGGRRAGAALACDRGHGRGGGRLAGRRAHLQRAQRRHRAGEEALTLAHLSSH